MISSFYEQFVKVVCEGRSHRLKPEEVRALADGRVYTGLEAHRLGLVDEVGYLEDALEAALSRAHLKDAAVVAYDRGDGYRGSIYAGVPHIPSQINVKLGVDGLGGGGGFQYLWEPGVRR
jgi:protease-4